MLTGKQKSNLRSIAHNLNALFQVGKDGINDNMIYDILKYLDKHELLKVSILQNCNQDKNEIASIFEENEIDVVQIIGKTIVLYKQSDNAINPIKL